MATNPSIAGKMGEVENPKGDLVAMVASDATSVENWATAQTNAGSAKEVGEKRISLWGVFAIVPVMKRTTVAMEKARTKMKRE